MNDLLRKQLFLPAVILFAAVQWTFWPAVHNGFVGYDDPVYVTGNAHVQQGLSWKNVEWAFSTSEAGNWHPLTWLSHMLDCELFGMSPWGHHLISILFHAFNAALAFVLLRSLTGAMWRSLIVAAFFALHPLRVESVAWVAERKDVLSTFFFLLTLIAYARYVREKSKAGENARRLYLLCLLFFMLGLLCKPMLVTVPFVLLLLDYWPLPRFEAQSLTSCVKSSSEVTEPKVQSPTAQSPSVKTPKANVGRTIFVQLLLEKVPFFVVTSIFSVITIVVQRRGGAMTLAVPFLERVANALVSYCRYLGKFFFPKNLACFYPYESKWPTIAIISAILLLAAISLVALIWRRQRPYFLIGWLWFVGTLIPVIGLIQVGEQSLADRYTYIPSIGLLLALVWSAHEMTRRWKFQTRFFGAFAAVLALICALKSRDQTRVWKNSETLFTHAVAITRNNYIAHNNLGVTFEKEGRWNEAAAQLIEAIAEKPGYAQAHKNLGVVLERQGKSNNAIEEYRAAIRLNPSYAEPHKDLGVFFSAHGRLDEAIEELQQALKLKPDYTDAHFNLGIVYGRQRLFDAAIREYRAVLEDQPGRADVHNNLGVALGGQGRIDDAIREYVEAIELEPSYARARFNLGVALSRNGALAPAIEQFQEALKLKPDYEEARINLNTLLEMQKTGPK